MDKDRKKIAVTSPAIHLFFNKSQSLCLSDL